MDSSGDWFHQQFQYKDFQRRFQESVQKSMDDDAETIIVDTAEVFIRGISPDAFIHDDLTNAVIDLDPSDWHDVPVMKELPEGREEK